MENLAEKEEEEEKEKGFWKRKEEEEVENRRDAKSDGEKMEKGDFGSRMDEGNGEQGQHSRGSSSDALREASGESALEPWAPWRWCRGRLWRGALAGNNSSCALVYTKAVRVQNGH